MTSRGNSNKLGPAVIAIGAGLASGLLYSLLGQGTSLASALSSLSPLPIMIALLGFGRLVGLGALVAAVATVAIVVPVFGPRTDGLGTALRATLSFCFMLGLPALWLSYLASAAVSPSASTTDKVPLERILTAGIAIATTVVVLGLVVLVLRHGSLDLAVDRTAAQFATVLDETLASRLQLPEGFDTRHLARMIVLASAPVAAGMLFLVLMLDLWLAGKLTRLSGRLPGSWPDVARELSIPRPYGLLLAAAFATTFLGGSAALIASVVAMVVAAAFALQGLAVVHVFSRDWDFRGLMLGIFYGGVLLLTAVFPFTPFLFTLLGLVESHYCFRNRKAATPPKI
jgi:hypothetical protein